MYKNTIMSADTEKNTASATETVLLEFTDTNLAVLSMGGPTERVVTLTPKRLQSFKQALEQVRVHKPKAMVILGAGPDMFTAGADINLIHQVSDPLVGEQLAREGQAAFDEVAALPFPTVAAISGPCVGGGCELVLACTSRIISDRKSSIIGLPEVKLGILPGFGGTQRLPRLIGLPRALDIILNGKTLRPKDALRAGLVDDVVLADRLRDTALDRALRLATHSNAAAQRRMSFVDSLLTFTRIGRAIVHGQAKKKVKRQSKGFYPAPLAALKMTVQGLQLSLAEGLKREAKELGRLIVTPESKGLVRIFFLTETAKNLGKSARQDIESCKALVIGAGAMGAGIAGVLAKNGFEVVLRDVSDEMMQKGLAHVRGYINSLKYLSENEKSAVLGLVTSSTKEEDLVDDIDIVIEAVYENLDLKRKILGGLAGRLSPNSVIATNTSSLPVSDIAQSVERNERVIGMHFFNPVEKMPLVEIIRGARTDNRSIAVVAALTVKLGKFPIVVNDVPGFLVNRVLCPYLIEAAYLVTEGFSITQIDGAALAFGMPMGPLRLLDEIGLDVASHVSEIMANAYGARMQGPALSAQLLAKGRKGKKSGGGFYDYAPPDERATPYLQLQEVLQLPKHAAGDSSAIQDRLILRLVNEAVRCLDEGVAGTPGTEAANQIDLGMVMGTGFPPFRGGVLAYAEQRGASNIRKRLEELAKAHGERFAPSEGLGRRAENGGSFLR